MPIGPVYDNIDKKWREICLNCYLTTCYSDNRHLRQYCPISAGERYKVAAPVILRITQETPLNRRWQFIAAVKAAV